MLLDDGIIRCFWCDGIMHKNGDIWICEDCGWVCCVPNKDHKSNNKKIDRHNLNSINK